MASAQKGTAVVFGFAGGITVSGVGSLILNSGDISHEYKRDEITDADNEVIGLVFSHGLFKAKLMFTPKGASGTQTLASAKLSLEPPAKGAAVTLANFALASVNHARWVCNSWKTAYRQDGIATYELEIECSEDASVNLSTAIS